ncbi:hypothetical protein [Colwellia sp. PAMC 21821]|uniref:hypothetical protein n=1 Tax=Colwellia sp. PAMC 21821 TaxID=1816219 RepID=UPI0009BD52D3|nr:hypothetical protein [Colwellia sp. PAMC 21821]ARD45591.1 hypothetical protein A3Q33_15655 [Colwellia sp. PAMC 21821]
MEPNYSAYSLDELREALTQIDSEAFPENADNLRQELNKRQSSVPEAISVDNFDYNEKFYACPNCEVKIGFFSKEMNKWSKDKTCPHCGKPYVVKSDLKFLAYLFIPVMVAHFLLLKPILLTLGVNGAFSTGILSGLIVVLSIRLQRVRSNDNV